MAASPESAPMPCTKRRSILISLTAKRCRKDSEEKPVPKSSTDSCTPLARSPGKDLLDHFELADDHRLGDLQDEAGRGQLVTLQNAHDVVDEPGIHEVSGGQVDGHRRRIDRLEPGQPSRGLARHLQYAQGEFAYQRRLLDDRHDMAGPEQTATRMLPAHQSFIADGPAGAEGHLGLVEQHQLALIDGALQLGEHDEPLGASTVALAPVACGGAGPHLCLIHRQVGVTQQPVNVLGVRRADRDTEASADRHPQAFQQKRLTQGAEQRIGDGFGIGGRRDPGEQHPELVTAEARHQILFPHLIGQPGRHLLQEYVNRRRGRGCR